MVVEDMKLEDMILVSVDDHITEPPGLFDRHIPDKWRDRAPQLTYNAATKMHSWVWEGGASYAPFLNAVVTLPNEEWGYDPSSLADVRPGTWDVDLRVADMNANGILSSMCFPSFPGFAGYYFTKAKDRDLGLTCLQAYNDWHIDEWCGSHPGRFIPLALPVLWDPQLAAAEVRRVARKGAKAVAFSEDPPGMGLPSIYSGHWDPFFAAICDEGLTMAIHIGSAYSGDNMPNFGPDVTVDAMNTLPCWLSLPCAMHFLCSPVLQKFPALKIALSEGGTSWIPGFLDRMERHYRMQKWTGWDLGGSTPTEIFRKHFLSCFVCDPSGLLLRDRVGIENIAYEVDYPHSDCTWPHSPEEVWDHFVQSDCSADEIMKISHGNALKWLNYDPFAHIPRERATVGALRAQASNVDLSTRSKAEYRAEYEAKYGKLA